MFGPILDFFKSIGKFLGKALHLVSDQVGEEQIAKAVALVLDAETRFLDNGDRRNWVITALRKLFPIIGENTARLLVELAVGIVKKESASLAEKLT